MLSFMRDSLETSLSFLEEKQGGGWELWIVFSSPLSYVAVLTLIKMNALYWFCAFIVKIFENVFVMVCTWTALQRSVD